MYSVALDSDGVIADFDKKVVDIFGKHPSAIQKKFLWNEITRYNDEVEPFFLSLDMMSGAQRLIEYVKRHADAVYILTASGHTPKDVAEQKRAWYTKHFPDMTVVVVRKSEDKAKYATPTTILIDDRAKSIDPWIAAGGIGILHTSVDTTIGELQKILNQ